MMQQQLVRSEMTDHELAAWLRKIDPNWTYAKVGCSVRFVADGKVVASACYDNAKRTRTLHIVKGAGR